MNQALRTLEPKTLLVRAMSTCSTWSHPSNSTTRFVTSCVRSCEAAAMTAKETTPAARARVRREEDLDLARRELPVLDHQ